MRSFFLEGLSSAEAARDALRHVLPGQEAPWILRAPNSTNPLGYFNVVEHSGAETYEGDVVCPAIFADVSGHYWDKSELVVATLEKLQALIGGRITDDL